MSLSSVWFYPNETHSSGFEWFRMCEEYVVLKYTPASSFPEDDFSAWEREEAGWGPGAGAGLHTGLWGRTHGGI